MSTRPAYKRNPNYRRARADAVRRFRYRRKAQARELLGGCCSRCGVDGNLLFCAKDVNEKSKMAKLWTASKPVFLAEVERNVLLCDACFWDRLMNESSRRRRFRHGTMYAFYKKQCRCELCVAANDRRNSNRH